MVAEALVGATRRRTGWAAGARQVVGARDRPPPGRQRDDCGRPVAVRGRHRLTADSGLRPGRVRTPAALRSADRSVARGCSRRRAARTAELMERMTEAEWSREGTHSEHRRYTLPRWLEIYADHAHKHAEQILVARDAATEKSVNRRERKDRREQDFSLRAQRALRLRFTGHGAVVPVAGSGLRQRHRRPAGGPGADPLVARVRKAAVEYAWNFGERLMTRHDPFAA